MMVYPNLHNWQEICSKIYKAFLKDLFIMFNPFNFLRTGEELLTHSFIILAEGCRMKLLFKSIAPAFPDKIRGFLGNNTGHFSLQTSGLAWTEVRDMLFNYHLVKHIPLRYPSLA